MKPVTIEIIANRILKRLHKSLTPSHYVEFNRVVEYMPAEWTHRQKAWHLLNNTLEQPNCVMCGKTCQFLGAKYRDWCGNSCAGKDPAVLERKKATNKARHGDEFPQRLDEFKKKQQATCLSNHGETNFAKTEAFLVKSKETFTRNYGVDNPSKSPEIIEIIREKALERDYEQVVEKRNETYLKKIGRKHNKITHITPENHAKLTDIEYLKYQHFVLDKSCAMIAEELGCSSTPILTRFKKAGIKVQRKPQSKEEIQLQEFTKQFNVPYKYNTRELVKPKEIDLYFPSLNLAIELNGVKWHGENGNRGRKYHVGKTNKCSKKGIKLLHIADFEWNKKTDIVKSKLLGEFGQHDRIPARKCTVELIDKVAADKFLTKNYIHGPDASDVEIALKYQGSVVAIATFVKSRYNKKFEWEFVRYCSALNTCVQGGASKLLKFFIKMHKPANIITYADAQWTQGDLYEKIGFKFSHKTKPSYFYYSPKGRIEPRSKYQKHKLPELFDDVDMSLTEWEIMKSKRYDRIWDCGNLVYTWKSDENQSNSKSTRSRWTIKVCRISSGY